MISRCTLPVLITSSVYPARLLVYNAGTLKNASVGFFKVGTILLFAFSCIYVAPFVYMDPESPPWKTPAIMIFGAIPLVFTVMTSSPYVGSIHLRIPAHARTSKEVLMRWIERMPKDTALDFSTMRLIGLQKTNGLMVGELRALKPTLGRVANLERVQRSAVWDQQPKRGGAVSRFFARFQEPRNKFYVAERRSATDRSRAPGVWEKVFEQIKKQS